MSGCMIQTPAPTTSDITNGQRNMPANLLPESFLPSAVNTDGYGQHYGNQQPGKQQTKIRGAN